MSDYVHEKLWDVIIHSCPDGPVKPPISNYIPQKTMDVIIYPCFNLRWSLSGALRISTPETYKISRRCKRLNTKFPASRLHKKISIKEVQWLWDHIISSTRVCGTSPGGLRSIYPSLGMRQSGKIWCLVAVILFKKTGRARVLQINGEGNSLIWRG